MRGSRRIKIHPLARNDYRIDGKPVAFLNINPSGSLRSKRQNLSADRVAVTAVGGSRIAVANLAASSHRQGTCNHRSRIRSCIPIRYTPNRLHVDSTITRIDTPKGQIPSGKNLHIPKSADRFDRSVRARGKLNRTCTKGLHHAFEVKGTGRIKRDTSCTT